MVRWSNEFFLFHLLLWESHKMNFWHKAFNTIFVNFFKRLVFLFFFKFTNLCASKWKTSLRLHFFFFNFVMLFKLQFSINICSKIWKYPKYESRKSEALFDIVSNCGFFVFWRFFQKIGNCDKIFLFQTIFAKWWNFATKKSFHSHFFVKSHEWNFSYGIESVKSTHI